MVLALVGHRVHFSTNIFLYIYTLSAGRECLEMLTFSIHVARDSICAPGLEGSKVLRWCAESWACLRKHRNLS